MDERPKLLRNVERGSYAFWCPGCRCGHVFFVEKGSYMHCSGCHGWWYPGDPESHYDRPGKTCTRPGATGGHRWTFNGNMQSPTFAPSLLYPSGKRCHLFLRNGRIEFLPDCGHDFAGKTVPLEPFPE
jgi:hypothetical protein